MRTLLPSTIRGKVLLLALVLMLIGVPGGSGVALASGKPARSETLIAGPYVVVVNLFEDPPQVEHPLPVTVVAQDNLHLSGRIEAMPGLGTDAVVTRAPLTPVEKEPGTLIGAVHLPVRGAWQLVIKLDGLRGHGSASLDVTVAAPDAIPLWLGWLIGLSPLVGCAWLFWQQYRYRRRLLSEGNKHRLNTMMRS